MTNKRLADSKKIKLLLEAGHPLLPLGKKERQELYSLYQKKGFQPFFKPKDEHQQRIKKKWSRSISKAAHFGIADARTFPLDNRHQLITELLINYQIGTIIHDLDSGFIDFEKKRFKAKKWRDYPLNWLTESKNTDSIFLSKGPSDTNYRYFATHLFNYCDTAQITTLSFEVSIESKHKEVAWKQLKTALISLRFIDQSTDSTGIRTALRKYQKTQGLNADGRIGAATACALGQSKQDQFWRAQISLDKLRQAQQKLKSFIWINLPSFELQFVANDTLRAVHRIIIGKIEHPTPELRSNVTHIVSLPFWRVPGSIAKNEILPALKRNASYLEKEHMRIYGASKEEIDPQTVNWKKIKNKTFPYRLEQDPGPWNSLGLIKFEFSNQFSVYVHDTPSRSLFRQNFRSFSHGCMRADDPITLGKLFLTHDKIGQKTNKVTPDSLQSLIDSSFHQKIPLLRAIPIFVRYQTVTSDRNRLYFHLDLYRQEQDLIALFRSKNNG